MRMSNSILLTNMTSTDSANITMHFADCTLDWSENYRNSVEYATKSFERLKERAVAGTLYPAEQNFTYATLEATGEKYYNPNA